MHPADLKYEEHQTSRTLSILQYTRGPTCLSHFLYSGMQPPSYTGRWSTHPLSPLFLLSTTRIVQPGNSVAASRQLWRSPPGRSTTHRVGSGEALSTQLRSNFWKCETHCYLAWFQCWVCGLYSCLSGSSLAPISQSPCGWPHWSLYMHVLRDDHCASQMKTVVRQQHTAANLFLMPLRCRSWLVTGIQTMWAGELQHLLPNKNKHFQTQCTQHHAEPLYSNTWRSLVLSFLAKQALSSKTTSRNQYVVVIQYSVQSAWTGAGISVKVFAEWGDQPRIWPKTTTTITVVRKWTSRHSSSTYPQVP